MLRHAEVLDKKSIYGRSNIGIKKLDNDKKNRFQKYFSKIENMLPKNKRIDKDNFFKLINNEEFCKIITYIETIKNYYIDIKGKYSF